MVSQMEGRALTLSGKGQRRESMVSKKVQAIPSSGIRRFFELIANTNGVISLGVGEPDFVTPERVSAAAFNSVRQGLTHYTSNYGLPELRREVGKHLERLYSVRYNPDDEIIITIGVSEGLLLACHTLLDPGDELLTTDPYYVAYPPCVSLAGGTFVTVPTSVENRFQIQAKDIEDRITAKSKALLLGYPSNPTGAQMDREDLLAIARVAARHDLVVIADEIYDRLSYDTSHTCFSSLPGMKERTILLGGFSKAYAMTGWRVGWACAPSDLIEAMMKVHQYIIMSAPTPSQFAALEALQGCEDDTQRMVDDFDRRRHMFVNGLNEIGLTCPKPQGAFYAFPSINGTGMDDVEFAERLLEEEEVVVIPGSSFGESGRGHVRCCYAAPEPLLKKALDRMGRFMEKV